MLEEIHELDRLEEAVKNYPVVMVGFYSPHCEICKELAPMFKQLAEQMPQYAFLRINILDEGNKHITSKYNVESPTLMIFKNGEVALRLEVEKYGKEGVVKEVEKFFESL